MDHIRSFNGSLHLHLLQWLQTMRHHRDLNHIVSEFEGKYTIEQHPDNDGARKFAQLYILDPDAASAERMGLNENTKCKPQLVNELSTLMASINSFADAFKILYEVEQEANAEARQNGTGPTNIPNYQNAILCIEISNS